MESHCTIAFLIYIFIALSYASILRLISYGDATSKPSQV